MNTAFRSRRTRLLRGARPVVAAAALLAAAGPASADGLQTLKGVPVPLPPNLGTFVKDRTAAIQLGKALFWDAQTGGTGAQACATCHFQAGADTRTRNTVNPGANRVFNSVAGADAFIVPGIFPINTGDVVGSQGLIKMSFNAITGGAVDNCTVLADPIFNVNGNNVRQVTGRNTPTVPRLRELLGGVEAIDRTSINSWDDEQFVATVRATGRKKLVMLALWTEACLARLERVVQGGPPGGLGTIHLRAAAGLGARHDHAGVRRDPSWKRISRASEQGSAPSTESDNEHRDISDCVTRRVVQVFPPSELVM